VELQSRAVFSVLAAIAEFEREPIEEKWIAGMKKAQRQGKHCGRPAKEFDVEKATELRQSGGDRTHKLKNSPGLWQWAPLDICY
jgi:DNA invertase Pin-like site-specific DNA recombinase